MFSSKLYQRSANSGHILHAFYDTSVQFNMPSGFKRGITLELRIHVQLNYSIRSSIILLSSIPLAIQYNPALFHLYSVHLIVRFNQFHETKNPETQSSSAGNERGTGLCTEYVFGDFTPSGCSSF